MIYLLLFIVLAGGCSKKDKYVQTFKKDHMNIFPDRYIGKALENFFVDLKQKSFEADNGQRIVEFMSINDNPMTIIESATIMKNYG